MPSSLAQIGSPTDSRAPDAVVVSRFPVDVSVDVQKPELTAMPVHSWQAEGPRARVMWCPAHTREKPENETMPKMGELLMFMMRFTALVS
jgi:hypothetical protein